MRCIAAVLCEARAAVAEHGFHRDPDDFIPRADRRAPAAVVRCDASFRNGPWRPVTQAV
ncbi:MAG: hypothetical protein JNK45_02785 [Myxococcales bacterium]|nr:hypothetical protein [Myxococcales bacterium]